LVDLIVGFFLLIFGLIYKIYCFLKKAASWLSTPFRKLWEKLGDFFEDHLSVSDGLSRPFSAFGGFWPFLLFCIVLAYTVVNAVSRISKGFGADYWTDVLYSTTLGSFMDIAENGMVSTPATLVAIAIGGFLFSAAYDTLKNARLFIKIPCFVLYFIMSANLALSLSGVFEVAGNWIYTTGMTLMDDKSGSLWDQFVKLMAALPLVYILLLLCFITMAEYVECAVFGFVGLVLFQALTALVDSILDPTTTTAIAHTVVTQIVLWGLVFGLEVARKPLIEMLEDHL